MLGISSEITPALNQPSSLSLADDPIEERLYIADTGNNRIVVAKFPKVDPLPTWTTVKNNLAGGQIEPALTQFSGGSVDSYRALFNALGNTALTQSINGIGQLTPIYIDDDEAGYYFTTSISGHQFVFVVTLVKENGLWKIRNF